MSRQYPIWFDVTSCDEYEGFKDVIVFKFGVDGIVVKEMIFSSKKVKDGDRVAVKLLKTISRLGKITEGDK